jgi:hypothetical protein
MTKTCVPVLAMIGLLAVAMPAATRAVCLDPETGASGYRVPLDEEIAQSVAIVLGEVVDREESSRDPADPDGISELSYTIRVTRRLRGEAPDHVVLSFENTSGRYAAEPGESHVLLLQRDGDGYEVDACGNSAPLPQGQDVVDAVLALPVAEIGKNRGNAVSLRNGINRVDFTGDGVADVVVVGYRNNNNAHGFDVVTFYVHDPLFPAEPEHLSIVPIFDEAEERQFVTTSGGADCLLHDFRLFSGPMPDMATLIVANREFGDSFADAQPVTFTAYILKTNRQSKWNPLHWFSKTSTTTSKVSYCDVGEAFLQEFGVGDE